VSAYAWWEIGAVTAYIVVLLVIAHWPMPDDWDDDHCCVGCEQTARRLEILLGDYSAQSFDGDQRLIDKRFDEIVRRSW
jgi:hypothetical protein